MSIRRALEGVFALLAVSAGVGIAFAVAGGQSAGAEGQTFSTTTATVSTTTVTVASPSPSMKHYRGHVSDRHRTSFELVVRFRHSRPFALSRVRTGPIALRCKDGATKSARIDGRLAPRGTVLRLRREGYFRIRLDHRSRTTETVKPVRGLVERRHAMGALRIAVFGSPHGRCESPPLAWQAHRGRHRN